MVRVEYQEKSVDVFVLRDRCNRSDDNNRRCVWLVHLNTELELWHGAHKLDNSLGEMMMLLYFDSRFFCGSREAVYRIFVQYGNIILCMLQPKSYVLLGCSGQIFSTDILCVDHPKKSVFVPKPLYFNLLIYFSSSCAIHCLFFCGGCLFC